MKIALGIEYNGLAFHGWQSQTGLNTVQDSLEKAVSMVADHPVSVVVAGRTDTGVHAKGQVVHFETTAMRSDRAWMMGSNSNLSRDVSVLWAKPMPNDFHARFSATARSYRYFICNTPIRPALFAYGVTWHHYPLNTALMQEAAHHLIGHHDFTSYRALGCQARSPLRTVHQLQVTRQDNLVIIDINANAFLHHMVRNIAGVLMDIGSGKHSPSWAKEILEARNRTVGGITAPPYGLYLVGVEYPERFEVPQSGILLQNLLQN